MSDGCEACGAPLERSATGRPRRWCSDRCRKAQRAEWTPPVEAERGAISDAVQALIDSTRFESDDPRSVLAVVSARLAVALDASPANVALARELRTHVTSLAENPSEPSGFVDDLRARRAVRRIDNLLRSAEESA